MAERRLRQLRRRRRRKRNLWLDLPEVQSNEDDAERGEKEGEEEGRRRRNWRALKFDYLDGFMIRTINFNQKPVDTAGSF